MGLGNIAFPKSFPLIVKVFKVAISALCQPFLIVFQLEIFIPNFDRLRVSAKMFLMKIISTFYIIIFTIPYYR
jgi:hypothetical protein